MAGAGFDIEVGSVSSLLPDTSSQFSYGTAQPPDSFRAASVIFDVTAVTGTWTLQALYNGAGTGLKVFETTGITTTGTKAIAPVAPYDSEGVSIPSALSWSFVNTAAGSITATIRLVAVT